MVSQGKRTIDGWFGIVPESEKRKPASSSFEFSNAPPSRYDLSFAYNLKADASDFSKWG